jgi:hypothetical protein
MMKDGFRQAAHRLRLLGVVGITLLAFGCAKHSVEPTSDNPVPAISSLAPASVAAGGAAFTLTVNGSGFVSGSMVSWNGEAMTTSYVSGSKVTVMVPATSISTTGAASITVSNPLPGGGISNSATLPIGEVNPAPVMAAISPASIAAGSGSITLTVSGSNFIASSVVNWNGTALSTGFVSATELTATIPATDLIAAGIAAITVTSPAPGGGTTSSSVFTVTATNPVPTISSVAPVNALAGSGAFALTVNGTNFVLGSQVNWNGTPLTTTFASATKITAQVPASDVATSGSAMLTVTNPAPGGGTSAAWTFPVNNPVPAISSLSPVSASAGGAAFSVTVNGSNFVGTSVVNWNGTALTTVFVSATQITAQVPASDIASTGSANVTVTNPAPGGGTSAAWSYPINNPVPAIASLLPTSASVGGAAFTLTVNGSGFVTGSAVKWNGTALTTTYVSSSQITAQVPASDIASSGTANVTVSNPTPGGGTSGTTTFSIGNGMPTITSLSPTGATAGAASLTLTVNGANFVSGSVVNWNGAALTTTYSSATKITAQVPASDLVNTGTASVTVTNPAPGGGTSGAASFAVTNPQPSISSLAPTSASAGGAAFTLTVNGANFVASSVINWNSAPLTTTYVSATQITAQVPASDIANSGFGSITVTNPAPGGGTSAATALPINNPAPTIASLAPTGATVGGAAFTLTVNGANFVASSAVYWNGTALTTTFASATQLTAQVPASDIASAGSASVTVSNPTPGGGTSAAVTFTINNTAPIVSSLSPANASVGGAAFTLSVNGSNFVSGAVVNWNGTPLTTGFVSAMQLTAQVPAADIASAGTANITVTNPSPGGGTSGVLTFPINNPVPTITSISPTSATTGGATFALTVNGTNFVASSAVKWNGTALTTTFVTATQITAQVPASDLATSGTASVTVSNPAPGGGSSGGAPFSIGNATPTVTSLSPVNAIVGGAAFTLTVNGASFVSGAVVNWNGSALTTSFVSATQLTAQVPAIDISSTGTASVTVTNPAPGGGTSSAWTFPINNPSPAITSLSPASATAGGTAFTLTANGTGFVSGAAVNWNGIALTTTFVSGTQLTAQVPANDITAAGSVSVTVTNPTPGGGTSGTWAFPINNGLPAISSLSPSSTTAGGAAFTLTVSGASFVSGSVVKWNGTSLTTTYVSGTQITAQVPAANIVNAGSANITVTSPTPGGGTSGTSIFSINNPAPSLVSLSPASTIVGGAAFTLTVTGSNFVSGATIVWNAATLTTSYVSATQLTAQVPASDIATTGTASVTVSNPTPGGGTSGALTFAVNNPIPAVTSLSPSSATAGGAAFTLTVNGSNFVASSVINWNGAPLTTTYVTTVKITAQVPAGDIASAGTAGVTVTNPTPGGGSSSSATFTVSGSTNPVPTISSLAPSSATTGGSAFTLTVNGTSFVSGSTVYWAGVALTTSYVSAAQLTAQVPASDIASSGTPSITVATPAPGGGTSNAITFTVSSSNPVPTITSLSPSTRVAAYSGFTLTVNGTNFISSSVVYWNAVAMPTTYSSGSVITAQIPTIEVALPGTGNVTVVNPAPGGGSSAAATFTITGANALPTVSSISPTSVTAGGAALTLTVNGSNFVSGSTVAWNGQNLTTTFVSSTQLTAQVPAKWTANAGSANVVALKPNPNGSNSNAEIFTINTANPAPGISGVSPAVVTVGGAAFTATVTGSGFLSNSALAWNGAALTTTYQSATQLTAQIPASDISSVGTGSITVVTPGPGGGTSNAAHLIVASASVVTVTPTLIPLTSQQTGQFAAFVPGGGTVTWTVDGVSGGDSTVGTISSSGVFTPGTSVGTHIVAATSTVNSALSGSATAAVTNLNGMYTYHDDVARTGQNLQEYALSPSTVTGGKFGKLWSCPVDGDVYAQPLYVANLAIGGGVHNVVFIATQHDSVYAFDADNGSCNPYWQFSGLSGGATTIPISDADFNGYTCGDIPLEYGITGTPVIDGSSLSIYFVTNTKSNGDWFQSLHRLNLLNGAEESNSPVNIAASITSSSGSQVPFIPRWENQRAALAMTNGSVYLSWAAHCDDYIWQGWIMRYDAISLQQLAVLNTVPNGSEGGIWMSGGAPAVDTSGNIYVTTGNGSFNDTSGSVPPQSPDNNLSMTFLNLNPSTLAVQDFYTPSNEATWSNSDLDISASGALVLPDGAGPSTHPKVLVGSDKQGHLWMIDRTAMGEYSSTLNNTIQFLTLPNLTTCGTVCAYGTPAFYNNTVFMGVVSGPILALPLTGGLFGSNASNVATASSISGEAYGFPGPTVSVSAAPGGGSALIWALDNANNGTSGSPFGPATLRAYNSSNLGATLFSSNTAPSDAGPIAVKFTVPMIANGHVYVGGARAFAVYGPLN